MALVVIILAAGQGTRMKSALPKVLHPLAGKPLLGHVIDTARALAPAKICIVHGHGGEQVKAAFAGSSDLIWIEQIRQLGTGHAVQQATAQFGAQDNVLILYGDVPLIEAATLAALLSSVSKKTLGLLTVELPDPKGYGRIIRDGTRRVTAIIEEKDANAAQRSIREVNTGIMAIDGECLQKWLSGLSCNNAQGEYYLTDIIALANKDQVNIHAIMAAETSEVAGVNDRRQLGQLERIYQTKMAEKLQLQGVTLYDPARLDVRGEVEIGKDVIIDIDVILEGRVIIEDGVEIGPYCHIINSHIGAGSRVLSHTVIENSILKKECTVGPYARLRPDTHLEDKAKVGNFVEIKKSTIGAGSKVNHLSYIGDAELGQHVNVGAGTITCNYDGANKHKTTIEDNVFIGSNSALVAPIRIGKGTTIGAGSTIRKNIPENSLAVTAGQSLLKENWQRPKKRH